MSVLIPLAECEDRRLYRFRARNFFVGAFSAQARGFIGLRTKFGATYLFTEYHWETDPRIGTVRPYEALDAFVPSDIDLAERLPSLCEACDKPVKYHDVRLPGGGQDLTLSRWEHLDGSEHDDVVAVSQHNSRLADFLQPFAVAEQERWQLEERRARIADRANSAELGLQAHSAHGWDEAKPRELSDEDVWREAVTDLLTDLRHLQERLGHTGDTITELAEAGYDRYLEEIGDSE